jgi:hypothetical protein
VRIDTFLGIRNTEPIRSIPNNALSEATDVDISDEGAITRRNGFTLSLSATNTTAYSTLDQEAYIVTGGVLSKLLPDLTLIPITPSTAKNFCDFGKVLFTNDGHKVEDGVATDLKIQAPNYAPQLSVIQGTMPAGVYSAMYCFRAASGLESGSSPVGSIELLTEGGVQIAPIQAPAGYTTAVYMTDANGTVYYDASGIQLAPVQVLSNSFPENTEKVAFYAGKLWCSQSLDNGSSVIFFSSAFHYHLFDYTKDYIIVPGKVEDMVGTPQGLVIGTDAALYSYADTLLLLAGYGVVPGRSMARVPDGSVLVWTKRGVCTAPLFSNLTEKKASFPAGAQCSTAVVNQDGLIKFLALSDGSGKAFNARY